MRVRISLVDDEGNEIRTDESNDRNEDQATVLFEWIASYMYLELLGLSNATHAG